MKKSGIIATLLLTMALAAPLVARAASGSDEAMRIRLVPPVSFAPTASCPTGASFYGVALGHKAGSGTNCILDQVPAACPPTATAQFCQDVRVRMSLSFPGGRLDGDVTIFEAWNCEASCAVDQRWSGTITRTTRRFHRFDGGSVSGGGLVELDAATFDVITLDEVLVVTDADTHDE